MTTTKMKGKIPQCRICGEKIHGKPNIITLVNHWKKHKKNGFTRPTNLRKTVKYEQVCKVIMKKIEENKKKNLSPLLPNSGSNPDVHNKVLMCLKNSASFTCFEDVTKNWKSIAEIDHQGTETIAGDGNHAKNEGVQNVDLPSKPVKSQRLQCNKCDKEFSSFKQALIHSKEHRAELASGILNLKQIKESKHENQDKISASSLGSTALPQKLLQSKTSNKNLSSFSQNPAHSIEHMKEKMTAGDSVTQPADLPKILTAKVPIFKQKVPSKSLLAKSRVPSKDQPAKSGVLLTTAKSCLKKDIPMDETGVQNVVKACEISVETRNRMNKEKSRAADTLTNKKIALSNQTQLNNPGVIKPSILIKASGNVPLIASKDKVAQILLAEAQPDKLIEKSVFKPQHVMSSASSKLTAMAQLYKSSIPAKVPTKTQTVKAIKNVPSKTQPSNPTKILPAKVPILKPSAPSKSQPTKSKVSSKDQLTKSTKSVSYEDQTPRSAKTVPSKVPPIKSSVSSKAQPLNLTQTVPSKASPLKYTKIAPPKVQASKNVLTKAQPAKKTKISPPGVSPVKKKAIEESVASTKTLLAKVQSPPSHSGNKEKLLKALAKNKAADVLPTETQQVESPKVSNAETRRDESLSTEVVACIVISDDEEEDALMIPSPLAYDASDFIKDVSQNVNLEPKILLEKINLPNDGKNIKKSVILSNTSSETDTKQTDSSETNSISILELKQSVSSVKCLIVSTTTETESGCSDAMFTVPNLRVSCKKSPRKLINIKRKKKILPKERKKLSNRLYSAARIMKRKKDKKIVKRHRLIESDTDSEPENEPKKSPWDDLTPKPKRKKFNDVADEREFDIPDETNASCSDSSDISSSEEEDDRESSSSKYSDKSSNLESSRKGENSVKNENTNIAQQKGEKLVTDESTNISNQKGENIVKCMIKPPQTVNVTNEKGENSVTDESINILHKKVEKLVTDHDTESSQEKGDVSKNLFQTEDVSIEELRRMYEDLSESEDEQVTTSKKADVAINESCIQQNTNQNNSQQKASEYDQTKISQSKECEKNCPVLANLLGHNEKDKEVSRQNDDNFKQMPVLTKVTSIITPFDLQGANSNFERGTTPILTSISSIVTLKNIQSANSNFELGTPVLTNVSSVTTPLDLHSSNSNSDQWPFSRRNSSQSSNEDIDAQQLKLCMRLPTASPHGRKRKKSKTKNGTLQNETAMSRFNETTGINISSRNEITTESNNCVPTNISMFNPGTRYIDLNEHLPTFSKPSSLIRYLVDNRSSDVNKLGQTAKETTVQMSSGLNEPVLAYSEPVNFRTLPQSQAVTNNTSVLSVESNLQMQKKKESSQVIADLFLESQSMKKSPGRVFPKPSSLLSNSISDSIPSPLQRVNNSIIDMPISVTGVHSLPQNISIINRPVPASQICTTSQNVINTSRMGPWHLNTFQTSRSNAMNATNPSVNSGLEAVSPTVKNMTSSSNQIIMQNPSSVGANLNNIVQNNSTSIPNLSNDDSSLLLRNTTITKTAEGSIMTTSEPSANEQILQKLNTESKNSGHNMDKSDTVSSKNSTSMTYEDTAKNVTPSEAVGARKEPQNNTKKSYPEILFEDISDDEELVPDIFVEGDSDGELYIDTQFEGGMNTAEIIPLKQNSANDQIIENLDETGELNIDIQFDAGTTDSQQKITSRIERKGFENSREQFTNTKVERSESDSKKHTSALPNSPIHEAENLDETGPLFIDTQYEGGVDDSQDELGELFIDTQFEGDSNTARNISALATKQVNKTGSDDIEDLFIATQVEEEITNSQKILMNFKSEEEVLDNLLIDTQVDEKFKSSELGQNLTSDMKSTEADDLDSSGELFIDTQADTASFSRNESKASEIVDVQQNNANCNNIEDISNVTDIDTKSKVNTASSDDKFSGSTDDKFAVPVDQKNTELVRKYEDDNISDRAGSTEKLTIDGQFERSTADNRGNTVNLQEIVQQTSPLKSKLTKLNTKDEFSTSQSDNKKMTKRKKLVSKDRNIFQSFDDVLLSESQNKDNSQVLDDKIIKTPMKRKNPHRLIQSDSSSSSEPENKKSRKTEPTSKKPEDIDESTVEPPIIRRKRTARKSIRNSSRRPVIFSPEEARPEPPKLHCIRCDKLISSAQEDLYNHWANDCK